MKNECLHIDIKDGTKKVKELFRYMGIDFHSILKAKRNQLLSYCPYIIKVKDIKGEFPDDNRWAKGTYVALNQNDGTLDFYLNYDKIEEMEELPVKNLTWVLFHEFRHKIQLHDEDIKSVIEYPNWANFKKFLVDNTNNSHDDIDHILHEINPAEVDANIFASEMTGFKFKGNSFDINNETLALLKLKNPPIKGGVIG